LGFDGISQCRTIEFDEELPLLHNRSFGNDIKNCESSRSPSAASCFDPAGNVGVSGTFYAPTVKDFMNEKPAVDNNQLRRIHFDHALQASPAKVTTGGEKKKQD
jgi:hypothetical protein